MNRIINRFSGRVFKRTFVVSMMVTTMLCFAYHCGDCTTEPEKIIEQCDIVSEAQVYIPLKVVIASPPVHNVEIMNGDEDIEERTSFEETPEEVLETQVRENKLYYVNDQGYEYYLDIEYQDYLYQKCLEYEVEEYYTLFLAQMYHESSFDIDVISKSNDYGLMQINTCNHEWLSKELGITDFLDPYSSIDAGIHMMSMFLEKYDDVQKALVCYNKGESVVINGTHSTDYSKGVLYDMNLLVELD